MALTGRRGPSIRAVQQALLAQVPQVAEDDEPLPNVWVVSMRPRDVRRLRAELDGWSAVLARAVLDEAWRIPVVLGGTAAVRIEPRRGLARGSVLIAAGHDVDARPAAVALPPEVPHFVLPSGGAVRWGEPASAGVQQVLPVGAGSSVVGRDQDVDLRLDHPSVSLRHARVEVTADGSDVRVRDLGSRTGTFLDGRPVTSARLVDGSRVRLGDVTLVFRAGGRDDDGGRQGGGPHRREVAGEEDAGATSGAPLGAGPFMAGVRRTPNGLWLAVLLMVGGLALCGGAVVALRSSAALAGALLTLGLVVGGCGVLLGRRLRIMSDVT